jgi:hypothetical protein
MSTKPDLGPCSWNSPEKKPLLVIPRTPMKMPPRAQSDDLIDAESEKLLRGAIEEFEEILFEWMYGPPKAKSTQRRKRKRGKR